MPIPSDLNSLSPKELRDYGFARVRDAAFDAVQSLWARRQAEGMTQADLVAAIDADAGWVSKNLRGPGNWTLRTFGAFVESLRTKLKFEFVQRRIRCQSDLTIMLTSSIRTLHRISLARRLARQSWHRETRYRLSAPCTL